MVSKGRWLLSYDDSDYIRELYNGYCMVSYNRQNGIENRSDKQVNKTYKELLIANYDLQSYKTENLLPF